MRGIDIRPAGATDAVAFSMICEEPSEPGRWVTLESTASVSLIAELASNEPVGFLEARRAGDDIEIIMLVTHPAERRRGVASALLRSLIESADTSDCTRIVLDVAEDNAPAQQLYARNGFAEIARRPGYYRCTATGRRSDALLLTRRFASAMNLKHCRGNDG